MPRNIQTPLVSAPRLDAVSAILDKAGANITGSLRGASDTVTKLEERKTERNSQNTVLALSQVETEEDLDKFIKNFGALPEGVRGKVNGNVIEAIAGKRQEIIGNERNKAQTKQAEAGIRASDANTNKTVLETAILAGDGGNALINEVVGRVTDGTIPESEGLNEIINNPNIPNTAEAVEAFTTQLGAINTAKVGTATKEFADTIDEDFILNNGTIDTDSAYQVASAYATENKLPANAVPGLAEAITNSAGYKKLSESNVDPVARTVVEAGKKEPLGKTEFINKLSKAVAPAFYSTDKDSFDKFANQRDALSEDIDNFVTAVSTSEGAEKLNQAQIQFIANKHFKTAKTQARASGFMYLSTTSEYRKLPQDIYDALLEEAKKDVVRTANARDNQLNAIKSDRAGQ